MIVHVMERPLCAVVKVLTCYPEIPVWTFGVYMCCCSCCCSLCRFLCNVCCFQYWVRECCKAGSEMICHAMEVCNLQGCVIWSFGTFNTVKYAFSCNTKYAIRMQYEERFFMQWRFAMCVALHAGLGSAVRQAVK
jgi:hypothetical protein